MPVKKTTRAKKSARVSRFAGVKKMVRSKLTGMKLTDIKLTKEGRWLAAAAIVVVGAGVLIGASRQQPGEPSAAAAEARAASRAIPFEEPAAPAPQPADATASIESEEKTATNETPVTITGCLERDQDSFRLKDTSGTDAPTKRSWKSAFLKRSTASVAVVDASQRLRLPSHVGERVTVRGTMVDREMHVRSLQRVSASCDKTPKA
jgi:hypothetical protein